MAKRKKLPTWFRKVIIFFYLNERSKRWYLRGDVAFEAKYTSE